MTARRVLAHVAVGATALAMGLMALDAPLRASMFGEENVTLAAILTESIKSYEELRQITDLVGEGADAAASLVDAYQRVNAGVDALRSYSVHGFLHDFKGDVYHLYPGSRSSRTAARASATGTGRTARTRSPPTRPSAAWPAISPRPFATM
jgi:hypothetical protein